MDATIRREIGKTDIAAKGTPKPNTKPPPRPPNSHTFETDVAGTGAEDDGFEFLDLSPSDLARQDCSAFTIAKDVNLTSTVLIDILADKGPSNTNSHSTSHVQATVVPLCFQSGVVAPKASEWDEC
jgi:hypothetical protein